MHDVHDHRPAVLLAALSAGAGAVHLAMVPTHMGESAVEGLGFAAAGWFQLVVAALLLLRPTRALLGWKIAVNAALVATWALSRTAGLPIGAHAGHAESVSFVDLTTVALEGALIGAAAVALARPGLGARMATRLGPAVAVAPVLALVLASAAIASPSARDHAPASHGDHAGHDDVAHAEGHGDHHDEEDDLGLSLLTNGHQHGHGEEPLDPATQAALDAQLAQLQPLIERYPTIAAAEAAGFRRAGPFAPGLGTHYTNPGVNLNADGRMDPEDLASPTLIFDGLGPDAKLAGFMFLAHTDGEPEGFAGPNDHWHYHTDVCIVATPTHIDSPFGADHSVSKAQCDGVGGVLLNKTPYMVHVWPVPGYESDRGLFSEINPALRCADGTYHAIAMAEIGTRSSICRNAA